MKLLIICTVYRSNKEKPNYNYFNTTQGSAPRHIPGRTYHHVFSSIGTIRYNRKIRVRERFWGGIACERVLTRLVGFYDVIVMVPLKRVHEPCKTVTNFPWANNPTGCTESLAVAVVPAQHNRVSFSYYYLLQL